MMHKFAFVLAAFAVDQIAAVPAVVKPITTTEAHAVTTVVTTLVPVITTRPHTTVITETEVAPVTRVTTLTVDGHPSIATVLATTTLTDYLTEVTVEPATTALTELSTATFFTTGPVTTTITVAA